MVQCIDGTLLSSASYEGIWLKWCQKRSFVDYSRASPDETLLFWVLCKAIFPHEGTQHQWGKNVKGRGFLREIALESLGWVTPEALSPSRFTFAFARVHIFSHGFTCLSWIPSFLPLVPSKLTYNPSLTFKISIKNITLFPKLQSFSLNTTLLKMPGIPFSIP
jgi:hypothetical protein